MQNSLGAGGWDGEAGEGGTYLISHKKQNIVYTVLFVSFFSGKAEIIEFLQTNRLGSLEELSLQDQYKKTRTKIYNSRKTKRQITRKGLKKLGAI